MSGERTLPGLGLTGFWNAGSGGWKSGTDTNWRMLSALVQLSVISNTTVLPGSPANGDIYIVKFGETDANKIAIRDNGAWVYVLPAEGMRAFVKDQDLFKFYNGTQWITEAAALEVLKDNSEILALVSAINFLGNGVAVAVDTDHPGRLKVTITKPSIFGELPQIDFSTPPADGQTLIWDGPDQVFRPGTSAGGGGGGGGTDLPDGGASGTVLSKLSNDDQDVGWVALPEAGTVARTKYRYYRHTILDYADQNYVALGEIYHFLDDDTLATPVGYSQSSSYSDPTYGAGKLYDNDTGSCWHQGTSGFPQYVQFDFGPVGVSSDHFVYKTADGRYNQRPSRMTIGGSNNGITFDDLAVNVTMVWSGNEFTIEADSGSEFIPPVYVPPEGVEGQVLMADASGDPVWSDLILESPGGSKFKLVVANDGTLSTVPA